MNSTFTLFPNPSNGKSNRQLIFEKAYLDLGIDLLPIINLAHAKTLDDASREPPEFIDKLYWAHNMNRNLCGLIKQRYPDLVHYDECKRMYIHLNENTRMYFKKLDHKYRPCNIPTGHVIDLNSAQGQLFGRSITVLYVGPKLKTEGVWDEIECFMIEMRNHTKCEWASDLLDLSSQMGAQPTIITPTPIAPVKPIAPLVKIRNKKEEEKKTSEK
ncbi:MAG: hypothetical protein J0M30_07570 [Chitinophagales bacterium]|nr:hypothetical protein [Chitinophagales bacterium]